MSTVPDGASPNDMEFCYARIDIPAEQVLDNDGTITMRDGHFEIIFKEYVKRGERPYKLEAAVENLVLSATLMLEDIRRRKVWIAGRE